MKILIDMGHSGHVHLYKNVIKGLVENNHKIKITVRDKEVASKLLDSYGFNYEIITVHKEHLVDKGLDMIYRSAILYRIIKQFNPDIISGFCNFYLSQIGKLLNIPSVVLTDTEHASVQNALTFPFCDKILTPNAFGKQLGTKQVKYDGYHELAYLHPNYFTPSPSVLGLLDVGKEEKYIIFRFISWNAAHDIGHTGLSLQAKRQIVREFSKFAKVFITSETPLPRDLEKYKIPIPPERMHDALHYSTLYIGEGATMASECAVLGTPAIYVNNLSAGTLEEQRSKYGLIFYCKNSNEIIDTALDLLANPNLKKEFRGKQQKMLADKIDVTSFLLDYIENYPMKAKKWN